MAVMADREKSPAQEPPPQGRPTRIFLAFARGDDEPFVKRLHTDLTQTGFTIWLKKPLPSPNRYGSRGLSHLGTGGFRLTR